MKYDCHVHLHTDPNIKNRFDLPELLGEAGISGAMLLSDRPNSFGGTPYTTRQRLDLLMDAAGQSSNLFPFYWIDPTEPDAQNQIEEAIRRGVTGFKCICNHFSPSDARPMQIWSHIAQRGKPILFHSGILYDESASAQYNRPACFEPLLFVPGLRFAMAHVSWPWCDEAIALLGKWSNMRHEAPEKYADFFIDITPGTPVLYREDVLAKLLTIYAYCDNVMFGSDNAANGYNAAYAREWIERDLAIFEKLGLPQSLVDSVQGGAMLRFVGSR